MGRWVRCVPRGCEVCRVFVLARNDAAKQNSSLDADSTAVVADRGITIARAFRAPPRVVRDPGKSHRRSGTPRHERFGDSRVSTARHWGSCAGRTASSRLRPSSLARSAVRCAESVAPVTASQSVRRPAGGVPANTFTTFSSRSPDNRLQQSSTASSQWGESTSSGACGSVRRLGWKRFSSCATRRARMRRYSVRGRLCGRIRGIAEPRAV